MYYVGLGKRGKTLLIHAVKDLNALDCEIYDYYGQRAITKKQLRQNRYPILHQAQVTRPQVYGNLKYAVVS